MSKIESEEGSVAMSGFDHEKLNVYQAAVRFFTWADDVLEAIPKPAVICNQLAVPNRK